MIRSISSVGRRFLQNFRSSFRAASYNSYGQDSTNRDEPVKFSMTKAKSWKASYTRSGDENENDMAWFQPYVVSASMAIFLIYFCVLREENDLDELLVSPLYDRIEGLEEAQLKVVLAYNNEHNKDTQAIKARLKQLQDMKKENLTKDDV